MSGVTEVNQARTQNKANEILTIAGSSSLIAQDAAGQVTKAPTPASWSSAYTLVYDAWGRLVTVLSGSSTVASYAYDGQNWRITKTAGSAVWDYYYNSAWQLLQENEGSVLSAERLYVWGLLGVNNLVWQWLTSGTEYYMMADPNGCVTAVTTYTGTVERRFGYEAYGTPRFMDASFNPASSSTTWTFLYDSCLLYTSRCV